VYRSLVLGSFLLGTSWWDSAGAVVLLTGIVTIGAGLLPLALRPWVENKIRRSQREEESLEDWQGEARALCVELEDQLARYQVGSLFSQPTIVTAAWETGGLRRKTALVTTFGPTQQLKESGTAVLHAIDLLHRRAVPLLRIRNDHPERVVSQFGRATG
jgi:hypothetical protein